MATANINAAHQQSGPKALSADAVADLCKFIGIIKDNQQALDVWNDYLEQKRPIIEVSIEAGCQPHFFLSNQLASFLGAEVAA